jgi:hypothetical protein
MGSLLYFSYIKRETNPNSRVIKAKYTNIFLGKKVKSSDVGLDLKYSRVIRNTMENPNIFWKEINSKSLSETPRTLNLFRE